MIMQLRDISQTVHGRLLGGEAAIVSVSIDTRTLQPGDLYIGIKGENFDGNDFVQQAEQAGAAALLVQRQVETRLPAIVVADTRQALADLASAWRKELSLPLCAITGSNGKTTVKEMLAAILGVNAEVLYTRGNLNNDLGVPLTLLQINAEHACAVIEMGANHPGEIGFLCRCAQPDVALITNAGAAHMEGFGSLEGVAMVKGEIIGELPADGIAVLNADDHFFSYWRQLAGSRRVISFALDSSADVTALNIKSSIRNDAFVTEFTLRVEQQSLPVALQLAGRHNVQNALAASAAALAMGIDLEQIRQGLELVQPVTGRLQLLRGRRSCLVIDDTYNANPASLQAALDVLLSCGRESWVVLGSVGELGEDSKALHEQMGEVIKSMRVARLLATGPDAEHTVRVFGKGALFFASQSDLIASLLEQVQGHEAILIKGSRARQMERVAAAVVDNFRK